MLKRWYCVAGGSLLTIAFSSAISCFVFRWKSKSAIPISNTSLISKISFKVSWLKICGFILFAIMPKRSGLVMTAPFFFFVSISPIILSRERASLITVLLTPSVSTSSISLGIASPTFKCRFCNKATRLPSTLSTSELVSNCLKFSLIESISML